MDLAGGNSSAEVGGAVPVSNEPEASEAFRLPSERRRFNSCRANACRSAEDHQSSDFSESGMSSIEGIGRNRIVVFHVSRLRRVDRNVA